MLGLLSTLSLSLSSLYDRRHRPLFVNTLNEGSDMILEWFIRLQRWFRFFLRAGGRTDEGVPRGPRGPKNYNRILLPLHHFRGCFASGHFCRKCPFSSGYKYKYFSRNAKLKTKTSLDDIRRIKLVSVNCSSVTTDWSSKAFVWADRMGIDPLLGGNTIDGFLCSQMVRLLDSGSPGPEPEPRWNLNILLHS